MSHLPWLGGRATAKSKAYLNWMLLDNQLQAMAEDSTHAETRGYLQVGNPGELKQLVKDEWLVTKSGYVYIYVSNESEGTDVFFDNMLVSTISGPLLETNHTYPFGLTMKGISTQAPGALENKKRFNGNELQNQEFSDGSGLEFYDFNARTYDQQIGRFIQIDPLSDEEDQESWTPYHYSFNNSIKFSDPDGKNPIIPIIVWGYRAYRTYKTAETVVNIASRYQPTITPMVITTDALGRTVTIPEKDLKDFAKKVSKEKSENATANAKQELSKPLLMPADVERVNVSSDDAKTSKKDRVANQKPGERAQNQLDGITKAKEKAKKEVKGEKQNKIHNTDKSEQNLKTELKKVRNLNDAKENF